MFLTFCIYIYIFIFQGKKIEAIVRKSLIKHFSSQIVEGELRTITNFDVGQNSGDYRLTDHPYKINFLFSTSVKGCDDLKIPLYGFIFVLLIIFIKSTR